MKILLCIFLLTSLSCSTHKEYSNTTVTGSELIAGDYVMQDFNGKKVTEQSYPGQFKLIFFGFTRCQTVCPMGLSTMGRSLMLLPKSMSRSIQPLFVTVDPERDTDIVLKKYLKSLDKRLIGLRGTEDQLNYMIKKFRGFYGRVEELDSDYSFDHSYIIYLIGKDGKYLAHFSSSTGQKNISARIESIISEIK